MVEDLASNPMLANGSHGDSSKPAEGPVPALVPEVRSPAMIITPIPVQKCLITCSCGMMIPDAFGPKSAWMDGVRRAHCLGCGKNWYFRPDPDRGIPLELIINPVDELTAIARWED